MIARFVVEDSPLSIMHPFPIAGKIFSRLTVIHNGQYMIERGGRASRACVCLCRDGNVILVRNDDLRSGRVKSCGCLKKEIQDAIGFVNLKHGQAKNGKWTGAYRSWMCMRGRCHNPNNIVYHNYGGRGITICCGWDEFRNFFEDMGNRPSGGTVHRINNDGHYSCGHCFECTLKEWPLNAKWSSPLEQARNRTSSVIFTFRGFTGCLSEVCDHFEAPYQLVHKRVRQYGWPIERALFTPSRIHIK